MFSRVPFNGVFNIPVYSPAMKALLFETEKMKLYDKLKLGSHDR